MMITMTTIRMMKKTTRRIIRMTMKLETRKMITEITRTITITRTTKMIQMRVRMMKLARRIQVILVNQNIGANPIMRKRHTRVQKKSRKEMIQCTVIPSRMKIKI